MRQAERAVLSETGYSIALKEKELFECVEEGGEDYDALVEMENDD